MGFLTRLHVGVPRFTCTNPSSSRRIIRSSLTCADDAAKLTRRVTRRILRRLTIDADERGDDRQSPRDGLGTGQSGRSHRRTEPRLHRSHPPGRGAGAVLRFWGVDEHVWEHTHRPGQPSSMVTVLVDLTPLVDRRGPARLIDMRPGRSADVLKTWLNQRDPQFRDTVGVVTGGTGSPGMPPPWTTPYLPHAYHTQGHGPVRRRPPRRWEAHGVSSTPAAGNNRKPWVEGRPVAQAQPCPVDQDRVHNLPGKYN